MISPIFISYSSIDQKVAQTICAALESRGYPCWISSRDIGPGQNFQESIVKAIRSAKVMLLVFTTNANNSNEIKKELVLAGRHHVTVVPVRVEDVIPNDALAYEFATRQWIDLFKDWEHNIERLAAQIAIILAEGAPRGDAAAETAERSTSRAPFRAADKNSARRPVFLLSGLVVVALGLGGAYLYMRPAASPPSPAASPASSTPASQVAADESEWLDAAKTGTVPALRQYLHRFPNGAHATEAQRSIQLADDNAWSQAQRAGSVVALNEYVGQFPDGVHVSQVRGRIANLAQSAADEAAWLDAVNAGTIPSFDEYLKAFPAGAHAAQAQQRIADLQPVPASRLSKVEDARRFDGLWATMMSCPKTATALGFTFEFVAQVNGAHLHAQHGTEGKPASLELDGNVEADGTATIDAKGYSGTPAYNQGTAPPGIPYVFKIAARFDGSSGAAAVVLPSGRPCDFKFAKK